MAFHFYVQTDFAQISVVFIFYNLEIIVCTTAESESSEYDDTQHDELCRKNRGKNVKKQTSKTLTFETEASETPCENTTKHLLLFLQLFVVQLHSINTVS